MYAPSIMPGTIWITGITASGKTTLGQSLYERLIEKGVSQVEFLDGDLLRKSLDKIYGHSLADRKIVLKKIIKIAQQKNQRGITIIVSTVSHKKEMREYARSKIHKFMEVHLECSSKACAKRDFKGLYVKANKGELDLFPGVTEPYETSDFPDLTINTEHTSISECTNTLYREVSLFLGIGI